MEQFIIEVNEKIEECQKLRSNRNRHSDVAIQLLKKEIQLERIKLKVIESWYDFLEITNN